MERERIEHRLMRSLPYAIAGLFCVYLYVLWDGLIKGVFWVEGWSVMVRMTPLSIGYINKINMISLLLVGVGIVGIVVWMSQKGYLERILKS